MSVDDNATTPATKRKLPEFIQDDSSESREQKKIKTMKKNRDDSSESRGQKKIKTTGRRSPRRGNVNKWICTSMPTVGPPPVEPPSCEDRPRFIVRKILYEADLSLGQSRLLLTRTEMKSSPLLEVLKPAEYAAIFKEGLPVRAFDWHGREFSMLFKYLPKTRAFRLIKQWSQFLRKNRWEMSPGNVIEITGFRIKRNDGSEEICTGLHYVKVEMQEQKEATAPAAPVYKNIKKREPKQKIKTIKTKKAEENAMIVAVAEQQIVHVETEFPTAEELLVAEALLLLNGHEGDTG